MQVPRPLARRQLDRRHDRRQVGRRWLGRSLAAAAGTTVLAITTATVAGAHVSAGPSPQVAGAYGVVTFGVPHGCEGSPTTEVRIKMPESVPQVTPTVNPNWDVATTEITLDTPIEAGHGQTITERVDQVVYTAKTPLADGLRDTFELSFKMPDLPGETLVFPTIQTCEVGETAWIDVPAAGESGDELEHPAPSVELIAGDADSGHGTAGEPGTSAAASSETSDSSNGLAIAALVVAAIAAVLSGVALARGRT